MLECKRLVEAKKSDVMELMNHPLVRRHLPLAQGRFDDAAYEAFIIRKENLWQEHGYGPWAFFNDGQFAGWGGLQYEQGDADFALVLHPDHWGLGKAIFRMIAQQAFSEMGLSSITALLPPSRTRVKLMDTLGFRRDGELILEGQRFLRFRLYKRDVSTGT